MSKYEALYISIVFVFCSNNDYKGIDLVFNIKRFLFVS